MKKVSLSRLQLLVADGLGHGSAAAEAAEAAREVFLNSRAPSLPGILDQIHSALRKTRGAAIALYDLNALLGEVRFIGIGNVAGMIFSDEKSFGCASLPGIVGHEIRKAQEFTRPWDPKALLITNTDGLRSHWGLSSPAYAGLLAKHPNLIAGVLYRDFQRENDDLTVVVIGQRRVNAY
jgi:hypothetical protein